MAGEDCDLLTNLGKSQHKDFYYFTETTLHGLRYGDWKFLFKTQDKWLNGIQRKLLTPLITNLKLDPFERFHDARGFDEWQENRSWTLGPAAMQIGVFLQTLKEYPPRQKSFDIDLDQMVKALAEPSHR
jgi:hypothetical protein